ncbi:MAG: hypothetical protein R3F20_15765 [Planctomycetota bacterium]
MKPVFRTLIVAVLAMLLAAGAEAQCCRGAQDLTADSPDGRFRVEATSLTGTGFEKHGPYHYRFRTLERLADGNYEERGSFEYRWPGRDHFGMQLRVSPLGNGFLMEFPTDLLTFFDRDGTVLYRSSEPRSHEVVGRGTTVDLVEHVRFGRSTYGIVAGSLFLPLGAEVDRRLDAQMIWFLRASAADITSARDELTRTIDELIRGDATDAARLTPTILRHGPLAVTVLRERREHWSGHWPHAKIDRLLEPLSPWASFLDDPLRSDVDLVLAALDYPDALVRRAAVRSLVDRLGAERPEDLDPPSVLAWIESHPESRSKMARSKAMGHPPASGSEEPK